MSSFEIIWEFVSSELKDTELWPSIVAGAVIVLGLFWLLPKLKKRRYRVGAITMAIGLVVAECNLLLNWRCIFLYLIAGLFLVLPILCVFIPCLWNQYQLYRIKKLCKQQSYVEALERLNAIKPEWLADKQLRNYQRKRFFLLVNLGSIRKAKA